MPWFSARLLFECDVDDGQKEDRLCDESIRLIEAEDETDAEKKTQELGEEREHDYKNEAGATVRWRFVEVLEIQDLCEPEIGHGVEVYSRLFRRSGPEDENS